MEGWGYKETTAQTHLLPGLSPCHDEPPSRVRDIAAHSCCCHNKEGHRDEEDGEDIHGQAALFAHFDDHGDPQATLDPLQDLHALQVANHNCNNLFSTCKEGEAMLSSQLLYHRHCLRCPASSAKEMAEGSF